MKVAILSDTHSFLDDLIFKHLESCDEIWHAGDIGSMEVYEKLCKIKPVKAVFGNIDNREIRLSVPETLSFACEKLKVLITHIGGYPPYYNRVSKEKILAVKPDIFICGHSHLLKIIRDQNTGMLCINPGAAGIYGFHKYRTMVWMEIEEGKIINVSVVELAKRGRIE